MLPLVRAVGAHLPRVVDVATPSWTRHIGCTAVATSFASGAPVSSDFSSWIVRNVVVVVAFVGALALLGVR